MGLTTEEKAELIIHELSNDVICFINKKRHAQANGHLHKWHVARKSTTECESRGTISKLKAVCGVNIIDLEGKWIVIEKFDAGFDGTAMSDICDECTKWIYGHHYLFPNYTLTHGSVLGYWAMRVLGK